MANPHFSGAGPRTRVEIRTRTVPHTIDGITRLVTEPYAVHVPVPPRDWDRIVLAAVTTAAGAIATASVVWSTASIGDLLSRVTIPAAAYSAAAVFDLAWIMCMAVEWLARYDPARARIPRRAGYVALAVAMAAIAVQGWLAGAPWVGAVGAAVSAIAKGSWTVVLMHHGQPLDSRTQQWVDQQRAETGGRLALVAVQRDLRRKQALIAAEADTVGQTTDTDPDTDADPDIVPIRPSARQAVQLAVGTGLTDPDQVLAYVRKVADPDVRSDTVDRYLRGFGIRRGA